MKQQTFARELGIAQQNVSKMEKKKELSDEQLEQVAKVLKTASDAIKNFDENAIINNNILNEQVSNYNINPLDKISELYNELLIARDAEIKRLHKELEAYRSGMKKSTKAKAPKEGVTKNLRSLNVQPVKKAVQ